MRWATFTVGDGVDRVGLVDGDRLFALPPGARLLDLLGDDGERLARAGEQARRDPADVVALKAAVLRPPVPVPPSVRDFSAFEQHVRAARQRRGQEMDPGWYEAPVFYFSNPRALVADGAVVTVPGDSVELDYELEVAAVVGMGGSNLTPSRAGRHLAGYCILNDWSARDLQRREMRLGLGPTKAKDFATSVGPVLVTPDEIADRRCNAGFDLVMTAEVNGREWSRGTLADLYWSFEEMLAYASRHTEVVPGDVLGSGTCGSGCILELSLVHGSETYPWLRPGDHVCLRVDRLGSLSNRLVAGPALPPLRPPGARGFSRPDGAPGPGAASRDS